MISIIGSLVKKGITLRSSLAYGYATPMDLQQRELRELLSVAQNTEFGKHFQFGEMLARNANAEHLYREFQSNVPLYDYDSLYQAWWHKTKQGKSNVCWPGRIKYFALSSGTSGAPSKYIPLTKQMLKSIQKTSIRQILTLSRYNLPDELFTKGILMLGGSTDLQKSGDYFEGDLSGITASQIPIWFQRFYKPGKKIARNRNWNDKLEEITQKAPQWDIGVIVGVPAWLQLLMERIVDRYQVDTIHDIWPNLSIFVHGGVPFAPYRKGFEKLLAKPLTYIETYLASEGFLAYQAYPNQNAMQLVLNNGIFFEFIPFTQENFTEEGELKPNPITLTLAEVEEGVEYAIIITTNAGAWRYLIGDVVRFVNKVNAEIVITGRTKHFLSLCGEHLSSDNMYRAVELLQQHFNIHIPEFTVIGENFENLFAHRWYLGTDDVVDVPNLQQQLDTFLKELNDDYKVERAAALKEITVELLPVAKFYEWMKLQGKEGGQNKFPRVLKKEKARDWKAFVALQAKAV